MKGVHFGLLAHASWRKDVERVSVGSRLLAYASGRKDVEVRVQGVLGKVNSERKDYFGGRAGRVTQGKKDYSRLVE